MRSGFLRLQEAGTLRGLSKGKEARLIAVFPPKHIEFRFAAEIRNNRLASVTIRQMREDFLV